MHPLELPRANSLDCAAPALRRELICRPQSFGGQSCYVLEDPANNRFFRIGITEYAFISMLDGKRSIREVLAATLAACPTCTLSAADALSICHWVHRTGLDVDRTASPAGEPEQRLNGRRRSRLSPLSVQLPLFHPDHFFTKLQPAFGWCFSWPALLIWLVVVGWALRELMVNSHDLATSAGGILAAGNWIWLGMAWLSLKVVHECGHGVACKRWGGEVREAGVIFILFAPLAYVDVTSCWRLRSKWTRIKVAAAGMYVELFLAALATLMWCRTGPGMLNHLCFNVMITASVVTLLFNANPLMRFDGYYILSDLLELPNLYGQGRRYLTLVVRRYLFGLPAAAVQLPGWRGLFVRIYGVASALWRNLVFWGLVLTAATLLEGAGIVLSVLAIVLWFSTAAARLVRFCRTDAARSQFNWRRFSLVSVGSLSTLLCLLLSVPWPGAVMAPAIVGYAPRTVVRSESDALVRSIHVHSGQVVRRGQVLAELSNPELQCELSELEVKIAESRIKLRLHELHGEMAQQQAEAENLRSLLKKRDGVLEEVRGLVVRAPRAGKVVGRGLPSREGTYLTKGSEILSIGDEAAKEVRLSISQADVAAFRNHLGHAVRLYLPNLPLVRTELSKIEPRASVVPLDATLCVPQGGSLAVRDKPESSEHESSLDFELLAPRFTGIITLNSAQSADLHAGQRALVALRPDESVGHHLYQAVCDWVDARLQPN